MLHLSPQRDKGASACQCASLVLFYMRWNFGIGFCWADRVTECRFFPTHFVSSKAWAMAKLQLQDVKIFELAEKTLASKLEEAKMWMVDCIVCT